MFKSKHKGFTLIETLVAIAIFSFSITALISITGNGIFNTNFVKNKFTASYLALEGAELVRNVRDTATSQGNGWGVIMSSTSFLGACSSTDACFVDASPSDTLVVLPCNAGDCPFIRYKLDEARFNYDPYDGVTNLNSIFKRTISIAPVAGNPEEVEVTSKVEWMQGTTSHNVSFTFDLLNWAGN